MMNKCKIEVRQQDMTDCGAACLVSICAHYGLHCSIAQMRRYSHTNQQGTSIMGIIKAANKLGLVAKGVKATIGALRIIKMPAIAHTIENGGILHFIVVYSVTDSIVEYMDPRDGKLHKETIIAFQMKWTGVIVLIECGEEFQQGNFQRSSLQTLFTLLWEHKYLILYILLGAIFASVLGLAMSVYVGKMLDFAIESKTMSALNILAVGMILIIVMRVLITTWKNRLVFKTSCLIDSALILGYYRHLLKLPQEFFDTMRVGEILSRTNDAIRIRTFINDTLISIVVNLLIFLISFIVVLYYSWKLSLIIGGALPVFAVIFFLYNKVNKKYQRRIVESNADFSSQMVESIANISTVKQLGAESFIAKTNEFFFKNLLLHTKRATQIGIFTGSFVDLISNVVIVAVLWFGGYLILIKELSPGNIVTIYSLIGIVFSPIYVLISSNRSMQEALIATERLFQIMDIEMEYDQEGMISMEREEVGDIIFKNIRFSYGVRKELFTSLNLRIKKGTLTAIVGESGCGKSTIVSLLQGLYPIKNGQIYIGENEIGCISRKSLRGIIGVVPQKCELFSGSVLFNVSLGDEEPNIQRVNEVLTEVGLSDFIQNLPQGIYTKISEQGVGLSGGEKQRLSIARVLYRNPEVYIFDEATSSLDVVAEDRIQCLIDKLVLEGKTVIMVAHRMRTIKQADNIIVIGEQQVIEEGNFLSLIEKKGVFYRIWNS